MQKNSQRKIKLNTKSLANLKTPKANQNPQSMERTINYSQEQLFQELAQNQAFFPSINDKHQQYTQYGSTSKLPNITQLLNMNKKVLSDQVKQVIIEVTEYARHLENVVRIKDKEIDRLQFMNNFLTISSQKKDEVIESSRKTIIDLKDQINKMESVQKQLGNNSIPSARTTRILSQNMDDQYQKQISKSFKEENQNKQVTIKFSNTNQNQQFLISENNSPTINTPVGSTKNFQNKENQQNSIILNKSQHLNVGGRQYTTVQKSQRKTRIQETNKQDQRELSMSHDFNINIQQSNIIRIDMSDSQAMQVFQNYDHYQYLASLISDQEQFYEIMKRQTQVQVSNMHEKIRKLLQEFKLFFLLIMRLKKIIRAAFHMTSSLVLVEALQKIVDETCSCLECDRCSVFVVDEHKQELWSKVASGTKKILRFPMNKGLAGYVATNKEVLNIVNAYQDERFNKEFDKELNYKTQSILVVPVIDEQGRCLGVLQCINKITGTHFSKDDEELVGMIADFSRIVLQNAINFDEQHVTHNKLRHIIYTGISLYSQPTLQDIIITGVQKLKEMMYCDDARILMNDFEGNFYYYNENQEKVQVEQAGIAARVFKDKQLFTAKNFQEDQLYHPEIDLPTNMPTICVNISHPQFKEPLGVIQVVNIKGIGELFTKKKIRLIPIAEEILGYFIKQFSQVLVTRYQQENIYQDFITKADTVEGLDAEKNKKKFSEQLQDYEQQLQNTRNQNRKKTNIPSNKFLDQIDQHQKLYEQKQKENQNNELEQEQEEQ